MVQTGLFQVYPKVEAPQRTIDVVAVHGLNGDRVNTWTYRKSGISGKLAKSEVFWLEDLLPKKLPNARILSYGYNAGAAFTRSKAGVIDHAKGLLSSLLDAREEDDQRPLCFVAHSLGGIIVKQALVQSRLDSRHYPIRDHTLGVIFLGTPHYGSDFADDGKVLATIAQKIIHGPPARLISELQTNSQVLDQLSDEFRHEAPKHIFSFYELKPMSGLSTLVVEKRSALLNVAGEEQLPVDADHSAMCKFEGEDDDTFKKVYMRIARMQKTSQQEASMNIPVAASTTARRSPSPMPRQPDGSTPMHRAAGEGNTAMVNNLVSSGQSIDVRRNDGSTPMHYAAYWGQIDMVDLLYSLGLSTGVKRDLDITPMHEAANGGRIGMVDHLISLGESINVRRTDGSLPIHIAAYEGRIAMVDHLSSLGQDLGARTYIGMTPMHEAANNGKIQMLDHLRTRGQDINVRRDDGGLPVHIAAWKGHIQMVDHLFRLGQDLSAKTDDGDTPWDAAAKNGKSEMMQYIRSLLRN